MNKLLSIAWMSAIALYCSSTIQAQETDGAAAGSEPNAGVQAADDNGNWLTRQIPDAIARGDLIVDLRARYEQADQDGLRDSDAFTFRTRLGYQTASFHGFSALAEFEDIRILSDDDQADFPGNDGKPGRTIIADPEDTELNRAWIQYEGWDTQVRLGRQRMKWDNDRFIGNVGWRQNEQTFDAVTLKNQSLNDTTLMYGYIDEVNRIFGDESDLPAGMRDFESDSHLFNASYSGIPWFSLTGYAYLLDLENGAGDLSSDTFGLSLNGSQKGMEDRLTIGYYGEYAYQKDGGGNPMDYDAYYCHFKLSAAYDRFDAGAGYEVLGSDNGRIGFSTPLATAHGFNGWADNFLATPNVGLEDLYLWAGVNLPYDIPLKVVYHEFEAENGGADFGSEIDVVVSKKIGKHWTLLAKYAHYDGKDADPNPLFLNREKDKGIFWAQAEFKF